jgi:hypothetical protein
LIHKGLAIIETFDFVPEPFEIDFEAETAKSWLEY